MMKYLLIAYILLVSSAFSIPNEDERFCCSDIYLNEIPQYLKDYTFIKGYRLDFRQQQEQKVQYTIIVSANHEYILKIGKEGEAKTTIQATIEPLPSDKLKEGEELKSFSNQIGANEYTSELRFTPTETRLIRLTFTPSPLSSPCSCEGAALFFVPQEK